MDFEGNIRRNSGKAIVLLGLIYNLVFLSFVVVGFPFLHAAQTLVIAALGSGALYIGIFTGVVMPLSRGTLGGRAPNLGQRAERQFTETLDDIRIAAGIPMPEPMVIEADEINAMALGFSPKKAMIWVTTGALDALDQEELEGILAHEIGHIVSHDTTISTVAIGCLQAIDGLVKVVKWAFGAALAIAAGSAAVAGVQRSKGGRAAGLGFAFVSLMFAVGLFLMLIPLILARFAANILFFGMKRASEFRADAYSVQFTRNPAGISRALSRIHAQSGALPTTALIAAIQFSSPLTGGGLYSTHPTIQARLNAILGPEYVKPAMEVVPVFQTPRQVQAPNGLGSGGSRRKSRNVCLGCGTVLPLFRFRKDCPVCGLSS